MKIDLYTVGKIKEPFFREAVQEYQKRLSAYCTLKITEVPDEKTPEQADEAEKLRILKKEAERLIQGITRSASHSTSLSSDFHHGAGTDTRIITLEILGKSLSSEEFAGEIGNLTSSGTSRLIFLIGGSLGLHPDIIRQSDIHLSFSRMTFPHQLMRVILLEQIYRAFRILRGEPYHK